MPKCTCSSPPGPSDAFSPAGHSGDVKGLALGSFLLSKLVQQAALHWLLSQSQSTLYMEQAEGKERKRQHCIWKKKKKSKISPSCWSYKTLLVLSTKAQRLTLRCSEICGQDPGRWKFLLLCSTGT